MTYVYKFNSNPGLRRNLFGSLNLNTIFIIINVFAFILFTILISLKVLSIDSIAIRKVLKENSIHQKGSNINAERLRFDFNFPRKLTEEELNEIENEVNSNIQKGCNIIREEMSLEEAKKKGITGIFENKYGNIVSVYTIEKCSKEICTGPHVKNTCELGKFKIIKEESSSGGVRRIKAVLR